MDKSAIEIKQNDLRIYTIKHRYVSSSLNQPANFSSFLENSPYLLDKVSILLFCKHQINKQLAKRLLKMKNIGNIIQLHVTIPFYKCMVFNEQKLALL